MQEVNNNITDQFIGSLFNHSQAQFSESIKLQAKKCLLDYLGVAFAGARMIDRKGNAILDMLDNTSGGVSVIGFGKKSSIQNAALLNGMSGHIAELDDGVRFGGMHPGVPVLSALLPLAEKENIKGEKLLAGIIVGYEAAIRLSMAVQPSHKMKGYHATGTCGTIGAAIAISTALGFSKDQMKDALSSAAASASGILRATSGKSELKPYNAGQAALNGLIASIVARAGFKGPNDILGGENGLISMLADHYDLTQLYKEEGMLGIEKVYFKPYAACRHSHPAIEAALNIRVTSGILPKDIKAVDVITYSLAVNGHDHTEIQGITSAKMSTPYSVAVALVTGKAGIGEFTTDQIENPVISSLTRKVRVRSDERISELVPHKRAAAVEITTYTGQYYSQRVDLPKGEPENPILEEELKNKFISLALYGNKTIDDCDRVMRHVWNIEEDLNEIYKFL